LKLTGTHQLLVYVDDLNILGGIIHGTKKNTEDFIVANKDIGLEVNSERTKHTAMSRDQHAGQNHNIKPGNKSFERVEQFKYSGRNLTYKNLIHAKIKSVLNTGSAYYHSMQNLLSSTVLSKNVKIKIYITVTSPAVLYGCLVSNTE
jgi:hypothetical protein